MPIKHYIEPGDPFVVFNVDEDLNESLDGRVFVGSEDIPVKVCERLRAGGQIGATLTIYGVAMSLITSIVICISREKLCNGMLSMDHHAFSADVASSRPYLMRFARLQLRNDVWAEDAVAETLLAALEKPDSFGGKSSLTTWLVGILKYKIIDCLRVHKNEIARTTDADEDTELEDHIFLDDGHFRDSPDWSCPEKSLNSKQFLEIMNLCLTEMPPTMGRVFLMREWMEFDTDEICESLQLSSANVWVLLHRARLRLRECLQTRWFCADELAIAR